MSKITLTLIRGLDDFNGDAALYRTSEPVPYTNSDGDSLTTDHVAVSAVILPFGGGPETMIFPANVSGEVLNYGELAVTRTYSHQDAITRAGWEVSL